MTGRRLVGLIAGIAIFLAAFGVAFGVVFQVSREIPSTLRVADVQVLADENLGIYHDPGATDPVESLEFEMIGFEPPLRPTQPVQIVYIKNESDPPILLTLVEPCSNAFQGDDQENGIRLGWMGDSFIHTLDDIPLGTFCERGATLSPGEVVRARLVINNPGPNLGPGAYSFTVVFGAMGDVAIPPPSGMVSWWPADGHSLDIMGGNHGTLTGDATYAGGMVGQAFSFDGDGDFFVVPDDPSLNITGDVTVDLWAKRTALSNGNHSVMIAKGSLMHGTADEAVAYALRFDGNNRLASYIERATGSNNSVEGPVVTDSNFHHYAYVRSGTTQKLFMDGVMVATNNSGTNIGDTTGAGLVIGGARRTPGFCCDFGGVIDEVEVFNRALSDAEIRAIYEAGRAGKIKPKARIAFQSNRDGDHEIYVMDADGSNQTNLTNNPAHDYAPAWSPDGTKIAFYRNPGGNDDVYVMNADGTAQTNLTARPGVDATPDWSPDGARIVFMSNKNSTDGQIWVMDADGSNQNRLTFSGAFDRDPAWSPDGNKIAFGSNRDGNDEIYVMNPDGSGQTRLTGDSDRDWFPAWSPDGSKIVFASNRDGNDEIYVMNADGSNPTRLTTNTGDDRAPKWSPDGAKIVFHTVRHGAPEIYIMDAGGSNETRLTNDPGNDAFPDWSPGVGP